MEGGGERRGAETPLFRNSGGGGGFCISIRSSPSPFHPLEIRHRAAPFVYSRLNGSIVDRGREAPPLNYPLLFMVPRRCLGGREGGFPIGAALTRVLENIRWWAYIYISQAPRPRPSHHIYSLQYLLIQRALPSGHKCAGGRKRACQLITLCEEPPQPAKVCCSKGQGAQVPFALLCIRTGKVK